MRTTIKVETAKLHTEIQNNIKATDYENVHIPSLCYNHDYNIIYNYRLLSFHRLEQKHTYQASFTNTFNSVERSKL